MSDAAGKGPFVLIYKPLQSIKGPNEGHPLCFPAMWRWDEPLPEGWEVVPIVESPIRTPHPESLPPPGFEAPQNIDARHRKNCPARTTRHAVCMCNLLEDEPRQRCPWPDGDCICEQGPRSHADVPIVVDEPEWEDDEQRLAAQARCKDMAFNLLLMLQGDAERRDVLRAATELHDALPEGA